MPLALRARPPRGGPAAGEVGDGDGGADRLDRLLQVELEAGAAAREAVRISS